MNQLQAYNDVIAYLKKKGRPHHLLIGNGFSIAYDKDIFSYNALSKFIEESDNELTKQVFHVYNTQNFETIMEQLNNMVSILKLLNAPDGLCKKVSEVSMDLKAKLIDAITAMHPEHVFNIPEEKSQHCYQFLSEYVNNDGQIFSTDYDLLLYWVMMRNSSQHFGDGFGRDADNVGYGKYAPEDGIDWDDSELTWGKYKEDQNVHYLHGSLPLFDSGKDIIKVEYDSANYLLEVIKKKINEGTYPVFVAAGNSAQKMNHITHNKYLTYCYDCLCEITGSLVVLGFSFGDNDTHIIDAINKAAKHGQQRGDKLLSIYVGVFSEGDYNHMKSIEDKFQTKVNYFDARTAHIWE